MWFLNWLSSLFKPKASPPPPASSLPPPFFDDFNGPAGSKPNSKSWFVPNGYIEGGRTTGMAETKASAVELDGNGNLKITATHDLTAGTYTSGSVISGVLRNDNSFGGVPNPVFVTVGYGLIEARIKMPTGEGIWPAFWCCGTQRPTWPACGEIDIAEQFSTNTINRPAIHFPPGSLTQGSTYLTAQGPVPSPSDGFHTYWLRWAQDSIKMGVDTTTITDWTPASLPVGSPWVFNNQKMFVLFDLAVTELVGPVEPAAFPAVMLVDWVRYTPDA